MKNIFRFLPFVLLLLVSCNKDENEIEIPNEEELITTIRLNFVNENDHTDVVVFEYKDLDGDGANPPVVTTPNLKPNTNYDLNVELLNEQGAVAEDIDDEVLAEALEHQFFYTTQGVVITYNDNDGLNNPIGLKNKAVTGNDGSGSIRVILRHLPNKLAEKVATGDITNAGGSTDIDVTFDFTIGASK